MKISIESAAEKLRAGELVAFATETVYGLGGNALDDAAVAEIFARKGRPGFNPLIIHVPDLVTAQRYVTLTPLAEKLADAFWPGALTLVLPRKMKCDVSLLASAGLDTLAIRVPAHEGARALLAEAGIPVAAPSANRSGRISPTRAEHVESEFGAQQLVVDGGACAVGLESTVVQAAAHVPVILRPGSVTAEMIERACGVAPQFAAAGDKVQAPGMLASHYAPSVKVRLNAVDVQPGEALLAFGGNVPEGAAAMRNLSEAGDVKEAAANLFAFLRELDDARFTAIAVMPIPHEGLGLAINDRLKRAAA